mmetsp:Transcript_13962/g.37553  ORF Transcript_13962/g.37553 Transcript_13962/m.37553 type:complete len:254 (-) Transcript_13962:188-949(-)
MHFRVQVLSQRLAVLGKLGHARGECVDVEEVNVADVHAHGGLGCLKHSRRLLLVYQDLTQLVHALGGERVAALDELSAPRIKVVVIDHLHELGKVPAVPLAHAHGECVDVLLQEVEESNGLDDVLVSAVYVKLDLGTGIGVSQAQLRLLQVTRAKAFDELVQVAAHAAQELVDEVIGDARDASGLLDGAANLGIRHSQGKLGLLLAPLEGLAQVTLQELAQCIGHHALADVVDVLQCVLGRREWQEGLQRADL